jgi:23S rRNA (uracil1939-C5)-methyltransferase
MSLVKSGQARVSYIDSNGLGVLQSDADEIAIPYLCRGEEVEYEKHQYRSKTNFVLKSIKEKSSDRIEPFCKYYTKCGGCNLQHLNSDSYNNIKRNILEDITLKTCAKDLNPKLINLKDYKRRRINLFFKRDSSKFRLGLYKYKSDEIIDIQECPVSIIEISDVINEIRKFIFNLSSEKSKGEVHVLKSSNGIAIIIEFLSEEYFDEARKRKFKSLLNINSVVSVEVKLVGNKIASFVKEDPYIIFDQVQVKVRPDSFMQPTFESDVVIPEIIVGMLKNSGKKVADLFCGRGTYTIPLIKSGFDVDCYENDQESLVALSEALQSFNYDMKFQKRDLYQNPLQDELASYDAIIMNPPRTGANVQSKAIVNYSKLSKVIYVSCNPKSFLNDAIILSEKFKLTNLIGIDQFKYTNHLEIIAEFVQK